MENVTVPQISGKLLDNVIADYEEAIEYITNGMTAKMADDYLRANHMSHGLCLYIFNVYHINIEDSLFLNQCFETRNFLMSDIHSTLYLVPPPEWHDKFELIKDGLTDRVKIMKRVKELYYGESIN